MWASGSYPTMVETFLLPLGPRLVDAIGVRPGDTVLDVAAGTGNAALPAARAGADVTASDLTPELLDAGRAIAEAEGLELRWAEADAEHLPFADASFDVVMSAIGAMFAPFHQPVADELVRVCRPGGRIGLLELDARRDDRRALPHHRPVRAAAPARRAAPAAVGRRGAPARAVRRPRRAAAASRRASSRSPRSPSRTSTARTSRTTTARRSPPAPTRSRTAARRSSTPRSTRSATSGTAAPPTPRGSRWSTCSPSARAR